MRRDNPAPSPLDLTQEDLTTIIEDLPVLESMLPNGKRSGTDAPVRGGENETPLPIRVDVLATKDTITAWAFQLAKTLMEETTWRPPRKATAKSILVEVSERRVGHFVNHPDPQIREAFNRDARRMAKKIEATCHPKGIRWVYTTVACATAIDGVPCPGEYYVRLDPDYEFSAKDPSTWKPFICRIKNQVTNPDGNTVTTYTLNPDHRIPFQEWVFAGQMAKERGTTPHDELVRGRR